MPDRKFAADLHPRRPRDLVVFDRILAIGLREFAARTALFDSHCPAAIQPPWWLQVPDWCKRLERDPATPTSRRSVSIPRWVAAAFVRRDVALRPPGLPFRWGPDVGPLARNQRVACSGKRTAAPHISDTICRGVRACRSRTINSGVAEWTIWYAAMFPWGTST